MTNKRFLILRNENSNAGCVGLYVLDNADGWYVNVSGPYRERFNPQFINEEKSVLCSFDLAAESVHLLLQSIDEYVHGIRDYVKSGRRMGGSNAKDGY